MRAGRASCMTFQVKCFGSVNRVGMIYSLHKLRDIREGLRYTCETVEEGR